MRELLLPYGKETLRAEIEEEHLVGVFVSKLHDYKAPMEGNRLAQETLEHPIGTPKLYDMAIDRKKAAAISSGCTRPVPSHIIMPLILKEIRKGNPDVEITILISMRFHRETIGKGLESKFGPKITENGTIIVHDCDDTGDMVCLGKLPSGGNLYINKLAVEADLPAAEGLIESHFFAGSSSSRESVLPSVTSRKTAIYNHNSVSIGDPRSRTGVIEGNPIHNDILYAARMVRLDFIVDVVIGSAYEPIFTVAGDCDLTHRVGREFLASKYRVDAVPADIVISTDGGYPLDQNIYQPIKDITVAEVTVKEGGVITMPSKAANGYDGRYFHEAFQDEKDLSRMIKTLMDRRPGEIIIDQWQSQVFARVMLKTRVVFASSCGDKLVEELHTIPAHTIEEALEKVETTVGKEDYKAAVTSDGVSVIVRG